MDRPEHGVDIQVQHTIPGVRIAMNHFTPDIRTRVGVENIKAACLLQNLRHHSGHAGGIDQVDDQGDRLRTELRANSRQRFFGAVYEHDAGARAGEDEPPDLVVCASGNLALVYLTERPERLTLEELLALHPRLVDGLVHHDGIGFVHACGLVRPTGSTTVCHPPGILCNNKKNAAIDPEKYRMNCTTSVQMTAFMPPSNV